MAQNDTRKPWTEPQANNLICMIDEMMDGQGYVNFDFIAKITEHSSLSCERRAHRLSIEFTKKIPNTIDNMVNCDMRTISRRADEYLRRKNVDYRL